MFKAIALEPRVSATPSDLNSAAKVVEAAPDEIASSERHAARCVPNFNSILNFDYERITLR
jgi:hypothetical protein